ncbi:MAG: purine-nucleoside phosphorylase [Planctomycetota bacterium]
MIDQDVTDAVATVVDRAPLTPEQELTAIVLGSGLGPLADKIESSTAIPFEQIPGFARSTAGGHRGQLIVGELAGKTVVAMAGRFHRYEGWTDSEVAFPIRVMRGLGATQLIASNAAGGVNPKLRVGDLVVIRDHINWLHPRAGGAALTAVQNDHVKATAEHQTPGRLGEVYSSRLAASALKAARQGGFVASEGTYLATLGPNYETRAEYRMMRHIGADVVGMSTVGEVMTAVGLGMSVLAISTVSNVADPDRAVVADHQEVLVAGAAAAEKLEAIVRSVLRLPHPGGVRG